jgi:hypothetical protein
MSVLVFAAFCLALVALAVLYMVADHKQRVEARANVMGRD